MCDLEGLMVLHLIEWGKLGLWSLRVIKASLVTYLGIFLFFIFLGARMRAASLFIELIALSSVIL